MRELRGLYTLYGSMQNLSAYFNLSFPLCPFTMPLSLGSDEE